MVGENVVGSSRNEHEDDATIPLRSTGQKLPSSACDDDNITPNSDSSASKFVYVLAFFSAIGGFLFGYDTGVVSGAMLIIRKEMELSNAWHEAIVASTIAAAWIFSLFGGYLSDRLGRKPVILAASVVFTVGSIIMGAADGKEVLLAGRIVVGIGIGWMSTTVSVYIAEASPAHLRGRLVAFQSVMITMGRFFGALASAVAFTLYPPVTGRKQPVLMMTTDLLTATKAAGAHLSHSHHHLPFRLQWLDVLNFSSRRYMLGIAAIPAVVQFVGFLLMPESPRWLFSHGKPEEARKVLQRIRGPCHNIDDELEAIKASVDESERELGYRRQRGQTANVIIQILQSAPVRRALFLGCLLQMFQQIAGINTVMYYSATIIQMAGFYDTAKAIWLSALVASVNFICTFLGIYLVEKVGRRRLTLGSLLGVVLSLAFLAVGFMIVDSNGYAVTEFYHNKTDLCNSALECNECNSIIDCGFCFMDNPASGGILKGSCLLSKENSTFMSDYGPCSNLSSMAGFSGSAAAAGQSPFIYAYGWCPSPHGWITVLGLMTYLLFFAPGMGPMPWTINAEIYPLWARSTCNSIATSTNWFFNFLVSMTFLTITEILTRQGAFIFYCALSTVGLLLFWWLLPETKGRTLEEMEVVFSRPRSCPMPWGSWTSKKSKTGDIASSPDSGPESSKNVQFHDSSRI
ncbi:proton myo-inositol cotransporter-like isoform X1 [Daphnia carinata]|uniref:proton myo-inositol cotransporter-like isoform X1 n=1 Tax=Daphnia carinata TaxID=120202 RepID=UPI00257C2E26|nr:proton myo-inositol cotransporter-like isoform X1 [Daphnia carinata]